MCFLIHPALHFKPALMSRALGSSSERILSKGLQKLWRQPLDWIAGRKVTSFQSTEFGDTEIPETIPTALTPLSFLFGRSHGLFFLPEITNCCLLQWSVGEIYGDWLQASPLPRRSAQSFQQAQRWRWESDSFESGKKGANVVNHGKSW